MKPPLTLSLFLILLFLLPSPSSPLPTLRATVTTCIDWTTLYSPYWSRFPQCHNPGLSSPACCRLYDFMDTSILIFKTQLSCDVTNADFFRDKFSTYCTGEQAPSTDSEPNGGSGTGDDGGPGRPIATGNGQGGHGDEDGIVILADGTTQITSSGSGSGTASGDGNTGGSAPGDTGDAGGTAGGGQEPSGGGGSSCLTCNKCCGCCAQCCGCGGTGGAGVGCGGESCVGWDCTGCYACSASGSCGSCGSGGSCCASSGGGDGGTSGGGGGDGGGGVGNGEDTNVDAGESGGNGQVKVGYTCFWGGSSVRVFGNGRREIRKLKVGDLVYVGDGKYSEVILWTHKAENEVADFMVFNSKGVEMALTRGHFVHVEGRGYVRAGTVSVGERIRGSEGGWVEVETLQVETRSGVFNPQTESGGIVVGDKFWVSVYTDAFGGLGGGHALMAPLRGVWKWSGGWAIWKERFKIGRVSL